jgi:hypothetical protein
MVTVASSLSDHAAYHTETITRRTMEVRRTGSGAHWTRFPASKSLWIMAWRGLYHEPAARGLDRTAGAIRRRRLNVGQPHFGPRNRRSAFETKN